MEEDRRAGEGQAEAGAEAEGRGRGRGRGQRQRAEAEAEAGAGADNHTDASRAFLQAFLTRGTLTFEESRPIIAAILSIQSRIDSAAGHSDEPAHEFGPEDITQEDFERFVGAASAAVSPFDYEVRGDIHQVTGVRVWALVNTTADDVTALVRGPSSTAAAAGGAGVNGGGGPVGTITEREQLAFVRRVMDAIFDTNNTQRREAMCVRDDAAIRLAKPPRREPVDAGGTQRRQTNTNNNPDDDGEILDDENGGPRARAVQERGLTQAEAARVLSDLVADGWLERSRARYYAPAPRALMELRKWLVDQYNDPNNQGDEPGGEDRRETWQRIKNCAACRRIITRGLRCDEVTCNLRVHAHCRDAFWRSQRATTNAAAGEAPPQKICPRCGTPWSGRRYVGEWVDTASKVSRAAVAAAGAAPAARRSVGGAAGSGRAAGSSRASGRGAAAVVERGEPRRLSHRTR